MQVQRLRAAGFDVLNGSVYAQCLAASYCKRWAGELEVRVDSAFKLESLRVRMRVADQRDGSHYSRALKHERSLLCSTDAQILGLAQILGRLCCMQPMPWCTISTPDDLGEQLETSARQVICRASIYAV